MPTAERPQDWASTELAAADPDSPWVHILRGQAYDGLADYGKSIDEFEAARKQRPGDPTVRFSLGFMYWKVGRFADAEAELAKAIALDPNFPEAKFYLAHTYLADQKTQQSIPLLQSVISQDPGNARARQTRARL